MVKFGLLIIGDEILHGVRVDAHFPAVKNLLKERGLQLAWVKYIGDELEDIVSALKESRAQNIPVFVTGGIGATPDDWTRQAAAQAWHQEMAFHEEAVRCIDQVVLNRGETDLNSAVHQQRRLMAYFPVAAQLIPNTFNNIPGFYLEKHYFFPGFPVMAHPMMEWVLQSFYQNYFDSEKECIRSAQLFGLQESQIAMLMRQVESEYQGIQTYSLPAIQEKQHAPYRYQIEIGLKAKNNTCELIDSAWAFFCDELIKLGGQLGKG